MRANEWVSRCASLVSIHTRFVTSISASENVCASSSFVLFILHHTVIGCVADSPHNKCLLRYYVQQQHEHRTTELNMLSHISQLRGWFSSSNRTHRTYYIFNFEQIKNILHHDQIPDATEKILSSCARTPTVQFSNCEGKVRALSGDTESDKRSLHKTNLKLSSLLVASFLFITFDVITLPATASTGRTYQTLAQQFISYFFNEFHSFDSIWLRNY